MSTWIVDLFSGRTMRLMLIAEIGVSSGHLVQGWQERGDEV